MQIRGLSHHALGVPPATSARTWLAGAQPVAKLVESQGTQFAVVGSHQEMGTSWEHHGKIYGKYIYENMEDPINGDF